MVRCMMKLKIRHKGACSKLFGVHKITPVCTKFVKIMSSINFPKFTGKKFLSISGAAEPINI